jgi:hypothetical protein
LCILTIEAATMIRTQLYAAIDHGGGQLARH